MKDFQCSFFTKSGHEKKSLRLRSPAKMYHFFFVAVLFTMIFGNDAVDHEIHERASAVHAMRNHSIPNEVVRIIHEYQPNPSQMSMRELMDGRDSDYPRWSSQCEAMILQKRGFMHGLTSGDFPVEEVRANERGVEEVEIGHNDQEEDDEHKGGGARMIYFYALISAILVVAIIAAVIYMKNGRALRLKKEGQKEGEYS